MTDHYERAPVTPLDVLVACETLLLAGYTAEAVSILARTVKTKEELRDMLLRAR